MRKQCIIVGLGKYGKTIARKLADTKVEVLAVDSDMHILEEVETYQKETIEKIIKNGENAQKRGIVFFGDSHIQYFFKIHACVLY